LVSPNIRSFKIGSRPFQKAQAKHRYMCSSQIPAMPPSPNGKPGTRAGRGVNKSRPCQRNRKPWRPCPPWRSLRYGPQRRQGTAFSLTSRSRACSLVSVSVGFLLVSLLLRMRIFVSPFLRLNLFGSFKDFAIWHVLSLSDVGPLPSESHVI